MPLLKFILAVLVCAPALFFPYKIRVYYGLALAAIVHAPYILFGRLARYLLRQLGIQTFPAAYPDGH